MDELLAALDGMNRDENLEHRWDLFRAENADVLSSMPMLQVGAAEQGFSIGYRTALHDVAVALARAVDKAA